MTASLDCRLADLTDALTIAAFDQFRSASNRTELPLPVINAFAAYRSAVDFALLAHKAQVAGDAMEAVKLAGWAGAMLLDMEEELATLGVVG